jgi:hypothetical protein
MVVRGGVQNRGPVAAQLHIDDARDALHLANLPAPQLGDNFGDGCCGYVTSSKGKDSMARSCCSTPSKTEATADCHSSPALYVSSPVVSIVYAISA